MRSVKAYEGSYPESDIIYRKESNPSGGAFCAGPNLRADAFVCNLSVSLVDLRRSASVRVRLHLLSRVRFRSRVSFCTYKTAGGWAYKHLCVSAFSRHYVFMNL